MGRFDGILLCSDFDSTFAVNAKVSDVYDVDADRPAYRRALNRSEAPQLLK